MPTETELLAARIAHIKTLIEAVERECAASAEARAAFDKMKRDLEEASALLKAIKPE